MFRKYLWTKIREYTSLNYHYRLYSSKKTVILGIETSCDDTGCAIVDNNGYILGEALNSQELIHLNYGGIIPPIAKELHSKNIEKVVSDAIQQANVSFNEIDAIAATTKPGLPMSLTVGMKYGKYLCKIHNKPFIPIHHMEAHALTARMCNPELEFPFLVLLISGGHCLLAVVQDVDRFLLMGESLNDAPGEAYDKIARRLKIKNIPEFSKLSGGRAIELAASRADNPSKYQFTPSLLQYRDCNFSLAGIKAEAKRCIIQSEEEHNVPPDGVIPDLYNLCAGFQFVITRHLCHRVQRAMEFVKLKDLIPPEKRTLVVSGGVACNNFIAKGLEIVCRELNYKFIRPPPKLCTDNGVMIAWNGMERWKANLGITTDLDSIDIQKSCPLGKNIINEVTAASIAPKWIKITELIKTPSENNLLKAENL